jgi:hypothetical protein
VSKTRPIKLVTASGLLGEYFKKHPQITPELVEELNNGNNSAIHRNDSARKQQKGGPVLKISISKIYSNLTNSNSDSKSNPNSTNYHKRIDVNSSGSKIKPTFVQQTISNIKSLLDPISHQQPK